MEIRVLIACDTEDAAASVARMLLLHAQGEPAVSCEIAAMAHARRAAAILRPDVALLDRVGGLHALASLAQVSPATRILLLDGCHARDEDVVEAIQRGALGCVDRSTDPALMVKAVRTVFAGGSWYGRDVLLRALRGRIGAAPTIDAGRLTNREEEILRLIGEGLSNKEIGRRLDISDQTVKTHLHRVYGKLQRSGRYKAFLAQPCTTTPPLRGRASLPL